ncbi:MAG TPA: hypothetical protein PK668_04100 [Myxococcota bacterium]|nr:hypothetical protein [Myxococcota bacterium]HRY92041.1 hypothetical protein [Myxococcota bacterium]HSA23203.1 hypothetical protein [Myxococcota bacterium]
MRLLPSTLLCLTCAWALAAGCGPGSIEGDPPDGGPADGLDDGGVDPDLDDSGPQPGQDRDGDGLDDAWEAAAGEPGLLDWRAADSDGDGLGDGDEDPDQDGLTNLEEQAAAELPWLLAGPAPHPLRRDLLVELDAMQGREPSSAALAGVEAAYAAAPVDNPDGSQGVAVHFLGDELALPAVEFDGSFAERQAYLRAHPPGLANPGGALPLDELVHVVFAARRLDIPDRGGEVLTSDDGDAEKTGVFVYVDVIEATFPACERPVPPELPAITAEEMVVGTLVHELGHCLQLGHDTDIGGGVNAFNVMAVPSSCLEAQMRAHGAGNADPLLGATEAAFAPRFSLDAAALMVLERKLSVEASALEDDDDGYEM